MQSSNATSTGNFEVETCTKLKPQKVVPLNVLIYRCMTYTCDHGILAGFSGNRSDHK